MPDITKQDALKWLDMQRDAINTEIAYAAPLDKGQYFGNLKIVNWIADRLNEMAAVEYLETKIAMCEAVWSDANEDYDCCDGCDLYDPETERHCEYFEHNAPRRAVEIVKRWKEERDGND